MQWGCSSGGVQHCSLIGHYPSPEHVSSPTGDTNPSAVPRPLIVLILVSPRPLHPRARVVVIHRSDTHAPEVYTRAMIRIVPIDCPADRPFIPYRTPVTRGPDGRRHTLPGVTSPPASEAQRLSTPRNPDLHAFSFFFSISILIDTLP